jgi:Tfp pilus assembly protein PilF
MATERIEKLQQFLKTSPNDCFLNHALALEYVKAGNEESAQQHFRINLINDPNYVATYYHLGKLLQRIGQVTEAITVYELGMNIAKTVKDMHSYNELQAAHEDLVY